MNKDALRAFAKAAMPGPWVAKDVPGAGLEIHMESPFKKDYMWPAFSTQHADIKPELVAYEQWVQFPSAKLQHIQTRTAIYIAAANPQVVLNLLDEIDALQKQLDAVTRVPGYSVNSVAKI